MNLNRPLRIAQVAPLWTRIPPATYGGVELLLKLLVDDLVERGHDVTLFASADCTTSGKLHAVCSSSLCELIEKGEAYMYEYYVSAVMADVLRRAPEFDIIHCHVSPGWMPLCSISPVPMIFTLHTSLHRDDEWALGRYPEIAIAGISNHQMHAAGLRLGREFPTIYNGCDFSSYEPSYEPGEYLAYLGRMAPGKNPLDAIKIAKAVGLPLVMAGIPQNGEEERYFAEEVKPLIDGEQIRWIGPVNHAQKSDLLRKASALLFPIQWDEPFGLVMIEAMACGCPVVAHRRGSVAEVVDDGITGFHTGVIDAMTELIPRALALDRRRVREHAEERFGAAKMVDEYVRFYHHLLRSREHGGPGRG
ncbi:MAG: glycosyltransferase family 4 protein [Chthoniobacteraceae bacterium]